MKQHPWWIRERHNPQLGTYYVASGQMSKLASRRFENPLYGDNVMHAYATEAEYEAALEQLKKQGKCVHSNAPENV